MVVAPPPPSPSLPPPPPPKKRGKRGRGEGGKGEEGGGGEKGGGGLETCFNRSERAAKGEEIFKVKYSPSYSTKYFDVENLPPVNVFQ